jgi:hypothetical protein
MATLCAMCLCYVSVLCERVPYLVRVCMRARCVDLLSPPPFLFCARASPPPFFVLCARVVSTYLHVLAIGGGSDDLFLAVELTQVCGCLLVMQPIDPKTAVTTQAPGYAMFFF